MNKDQAPFSLPAVMLPEVPEGICKLSWGQPHFVLLLRPRKCNANLKSGLLLCFHPGHMCFTEARITKSVLICITMKGEPVPNTCLIGQVVFCLFLLLEMSQRAKKCWRMGSKYPEAKSKLEPIHVKNLSVPQVSTFRAALVDTQIHIHEDAW